MNLATLHELSITHPDRYDQEVAALSVSFNPYPPETEASDDDLEASPDPDCEGCGQAIVAGGVRCSSCAYERSLEEAQDREQWVREHQQMKAR